MPAESPERSGRTVRAVLGGRRLVHPVQVAEVLEPFEADAVVDVQCVEVEGAHTPVTHSA